MKLVNIEGTIDLLGDAHSHSHGKIYSHMSFLTADGDEVLARNVCVTSALADMIRVGVTGQFTLQKTLFSTVLQKASIPQLAVS
ncbi:MAG: hypothetical protein CMK07_12190 [Ponticaulis sp.]|nr:hypothetical protein [Ponticaulis sp.]